MYTKNVHDVFAIFSFLAMRHACIFNVFVQNQMRTCAFISDKFDINNISVKIMMP